MPSTIRVLYVSADQSVPSVLNDDDRFGLDTTTTTDDALTYLEGGSDGGNPEGRWSDVPVDCIVSDYKMPDSNGLELLDEVREEYPNLPFLLYTADGSEAVASEAITRGVDDYLEAHPETDQGALLASRVERAVEQFRARQRVERLHDATRSLMRSEDRQGVGEAAIDAVEGILEFPLSAIWLLDDDETALYPVVASDRADQLFDELPVYAPGNSLSWRVFESGESEFYRDVDEHPEAYDPETPVESELILPLGEHGVMNLGSTRQRDIGDIDRSLGNLFAANVEAALDRAAREETRRHNERRLQRQNERLEEFAAVVSHDLRNPLHVAKGRLQIAMEACDSEHLQAVQRAHDRMEALIEDLLTFATEGEAVEETQPVSLAAIADETWEGIEATEATLVVETEPTIRADPQRVRRLLSNLLHNAVDHGGPDVTVRLTDTDSGFAVLDDGPGIPPEERDHVFESGYTTTREGTGFGLSIVKEIADAHGWDVTLTESDAGGTRVELTGVDTVS